jgi:RND superfamily putative drug exporter
MVAALTLLPALVSLVGHRISPATRTAGSGEIYVRLARWSRKRPLLVIGAVGGLLAVAALPFLGATYSDPDERSLPASAQNRQLAEVAEQEFPEIDTTDPVTVVGPRPSEDEAIDLRSRLSALPGVRAVELQDVNPFVLDVTPTAAADQQPAELVRQVRTLAAPLGLAVTGDAAELVDYEDAIVARIPWALGVIVLATFGLLFLMTGSLVIPLKALILNTLSLGAAFGALVWVFQDGHFAPLLGAEGLGSLSITTPVIVFAIAFGLSMDYEVFLLGRITEAWRHTGDTDRAVDLGLRRTGRVVTAAALLMIVVYSGFIAGGFAPIKQVGLGLVLAVLVDAAVVRTLLLPAAMSLLGAANWWAPAPLRRWYARHGWNDEVGGAHTTPGGGPSVAAAPSKDYPESTLVP